jgi:hypothetical protein
VSWPSTVVPSRNSTFVTLPSGSLAVAVIVNVGLQAKIAPSAGYVEARRCVKRALARHFYRRLREMSALPLTT